MNIDLSLLHQHLLDSVDISGVYCLDKSYYENTDIIRLDALTVSGFVSLKENDDLEFDDYVQCHIQGNMVLADSISLEEIDYPFSIEYDDFLSENCRKNENGLDIFDFLWENTVLEVPLQFTKVRDLSKFHGDGWRLVREDELRCESNPFSELLKDFEKE